MPETSHLDDDILGSRLMRGASRNEGRTQALAEMDSLVAMRFKIVEQCIRVIEAEIAKLRAANPQAGSVAVANGHMIGKLMDMIVVLRSEVSNPQRYNELPALLRQKADELWGR